MPEVIMGPVNLTSLSYPGGKNRTCRVADRSDSPDLHEEK